MQIQVIEAGTDESAQDPNWGGPKLPGEAFVAGNYGTLVFNVTTGQVLRYYKSEDADAESNYLDIAKVDVASYRNKLGQPMSEGDCEDIVYIGLWTMDGDYIDPELTPDQTEWAEKADAEMRARYAIGLEDAGLSDNDVRRYFKGESDPVAFVEWYGNKYDLQMLDPDYSPAREQALADGKDVD